MNFPAPGQAAERSSFRDPSGFLFRSEGSLYRQVNQCYRRHYDHLMQSGLYEDLVRRRLLIPHQETVAPAPRPDLAYRVVQPELIDFISYPYEWCFSQLKKRGPDHTENSEARPGARYVSER